MIHALDEPKIAGAGLDVTQTEPIPMNHPLLNRLNVVLTPRLAGVSIEARHRAHDFAIENVNRLASGKGPLAVVKPRTK